MTGRQTVVIVNDHAIVNGGVPKVAILSAIELARRGHRVIYFCAIGPVDSSLASTPNVEVVCLNQFDILSDPKRFRAMKSGIWNPISAAELLKTIKQVQQESPVIHVHSWSKGLSPSIFSAITQSGAPFVISLHDYFVACPTGGFLVNPTGEICHRKPLSVSCITCNCDPRTYVHKLWRVARGFAQTKIAQIPSKCENFISVSPYSEKILTPHLPKQSRIDLVRYPIEVEQTPAIDLAKNDEFLFVGRFAREKGGLDFARAATAAGLKAVFIGQGEEEAKIREACPDAEMLGWLSPSEVVTRMRKSRALVFPSHWYETQGMVAIEACAVGLPVIYADTTVISADLVDNVTGFSFKTGDVTSLAATMRRVADDENQCRAVGKAAYEWYWSDPWTLERHANRLEAVYSRMRESFIQRTTNRESPRPGAVTKI